AYDDGQRLLKIFDQNRILKRVLNINSGAKFYIDSRDMFARASLIYMGIIQTKYNNPEEAAKSKMMAVFNYKGHLQTLFAHYDPYVGKSPSYLTDTIFDIKFKHHKLFSTYMNSYRIQIFNMNNFKKIAHFGHKSVDFKESSKKISPYFSK